MAFKLDVDLTTLVFDFEADAVQCRRLMYALGGKP